MNDKHKSTLIELKEKDLKKLFKKEDKLVSRLDYLEVLLSENTYQIYELEAELKELNPNHLTRDEKRLLEYKRNRSNHIDEEEIPF